jgi:hypothetical protein
MEVDDIEKAIDDLLGHWRKQKIVSPSNSIDELLNFEFSKCTHLPADFRCLYTMTNGMADLYPNYMDEEGFLFYPLQELSTWEEEFNIPSPAPSPYEKCLFFAEYLHKSWWYGVRFSNYTDEYEIGIVSTRFKVIARSLGTFIRLYLKDDPILYDY